MISSENCQVFPISSKIAYVLVPWVGVNSRWGSIISISLFDWGSIRIFVGWGSNQDWGSIHADTVDEKPNIFRIHYKNAKNACFIK